jgi:hypothetical protein
MHFLNRERSTRGGHGGFLPQLMRSAAFLVAGLRISAPVMDTVSVLGCVCVLLAASLVGEFQLLQLRYAKASAVQHWAGPLQVVKTDLEADPDLQAEIDAILSRPVFSKTRRPVQAGGGPEAYRRLTGVIVSDGMRIAIFADSASGKSVSVSEGDRIADYVVESISAGQAMVQGPSGAQLLYPRFEGARGDLRSAASIEEDAGQRLVPDQVIRGPVVHRP